MDDHDQTQHDSDGPPASQSAGLPGIVRKGVVLAGAEPFTFNSNVNTTWRGQVMLDDGTIVRAFIKDVGLRELANEVLAAAIGTKLGLPIPMPILAKASSDDLPAIKIPLVSSADHLVFASAAMPAGPILQMIRDTPDRLGDIMAKVTKWDGLGALYGFDTWVANVDRHRGNFLFGGADDVWLIDHGWSFTGPEWKPSDLIPSAAYPNRLADWMTPHLSHKRKSELVPQALAAPTSISGSALDRIAHANSIDVLLGGDLAALLDFLEKRAAHVPQQSTEALGLLL